MLESIMMLWFVLTAMSALYVAIDIRHTPEHPVLKWAFILFTLYAGPIGALLYVFGCRKHTPEEHARFVAARWRQVLGSTMHCVAGDGIGILAGAVIGALVVLQLPVEIMLEYVLGFGFGWTIFQALFMRDMAGGSFRRSLGLTFIPEFLSMNTLMAGMVPVMTLMMANVPGSEDPRGATFWFVMSMALLAGAIIAYPMNWWLVAHHLKHGMMTVRRSGALGAIDSEAKAETERMERADAHAAKPSTAAIVKMAFLSIAIFGVGIAVSVISARSH
jgi:Domain of unknown function (DUF4396)